MIEVRMRGNLEASEGQESEMEEMEDEQDELDDANQDPAQVDATDTANKTGVAQNGVTEIPGNQVQLQMGAD